MGSRAVRITREEFVVPPEFSNLSTPKNSVARVGGARIELVPGDERTQLGSCYQQIPMRLMPPFCFDSEPAALLYLINLTAGLMDGDAHLVEILARAGSRAVVTGQSASRIHPAVHSYATQQWKVVVEEDACLVVLPGPTIPFRGSRYYQRGRVELASRGRVLWGDIWLAGRYDRGKLSERFQFERIVQDLEVRREGRLGYRDRFCWDGPWSSEEVDWYFGGQLACGSLFVGGPLPEPLPEPTSGVQRAVFPLEGDEGCIRWCGSPSAVTADLVRITLSIAARWTGDSRSAPWLLSLTDLAPNHWFSAAPDERKNI